MSTIDRPFLCPEMKSMRIALTQNKFDPSLDQNYHHVCFVSRDGIYLSHGSILEVF